MTPPATFEALWPRALMVVGRMKRGLPLEMRRDDLKQVAAVGLLDALQRYDGARGVSPWTFCERRVKGALLDHLRSLDLLSRQEREHFTGIERAAHVLTCELGKHPDTAQLCERLDVSEAELDHRLAAGGRQLWFTDEDPPGPDGVCIAQHAELRRVLNLLMDRVLSRRSAHILRLRYYEQMKLAEIGERLGISEGRVCQVIAKSLRKLRLVLVWSRAGRELREAA